MAKFLTKTPLEKAEREYKLFKQKELANLKSDFDDFLELREKIASYNAK